MTMPGGTAATTLAPVVLTANTDQYSRQMQVAAGHTSRLTAQVSNLSKHLDGLSGRAGRKLLHITGQEVGMLSAYTATAATFEKQMSTLRASATVTGESFKGIKSGVESAFAKFPTSRTDVIQLTEAISELGVTGTKQIASLTQTFIKLGAATGEPMQELASGLIQLSRLMGNENATVIGRYANALLVTSKNAGVSATGVLNFAQSIGPMARMAGIGEAGVIGISTAFTKAGADGYVAANTFNKVIGDIVNLTTTGSPELAKYANLIGVTTDAFAKMDKADAFTKIIEAISRQGPKGIDTLNRLGFEGVRTQASLTALAQSGDLQKMIATTTGATGGTGALDKASGAAFNNLADQGARVRNSMTQMATGVGTSLTGPLSFLLKTVNGVVSGFNSLFGSLTPIRGLFTILAAVFTGFAGVALLTAAAVGKMAMASFVLRSSPMHALVGGMRMGGREGPAPEMRPWAAPFFTAGRRLGAVPMQVRGMMGIPLPGEAGGPPVVPGYERPGLFQRLGGQALRAPIWLAQAQTQFLRDAALPGEQRTAPFMGPASRWFYRQRFRMTGEPGPQVLPGNIPEERAGFMARMVGGGAGPGFVGGFRSGISGFRAGFGGQGEVQTAQKAAAKTATELAAAETKAAAAANQGAAAQQKAAAGLAAAQQKAALAATELAAAQEKAALAASTAAKAQLVATRQFGALMGAMTRMYATSAAAGLRMGGRVAGMALAPLARFAFNPLTMALFIGPMVYSFLKDRMNRGDRSVNDVQAIQQYNDALGITTTQVAKLGDAAGNTTTKLLGTVTAATSMSVAAKYTDADRVAAAGQKATDQYLQALARTPGGRDNAAALTQLLKTYNITDPRALKLVEQQAQLSGFGPGAINQAGAAVARGPAGPANMRAIQYGALAKQIMGSEGIAKGWASFLNISTSASRSGEDLSKQVVTGIQLEFQRNLEQYGPKFAGAKQFAEQMKFLKDMAKAVTQEPGKGHEARLQIRQLGETMHLMFGGDTGTYQRVLASALPSVMRPSRVQPVGGAPEIQQKGAGGAPLTYAQLATTAGLPDQGPAAGTAGQQQSRAFFKALHATEEGRGVLQGLRQQGIKIDRDNFVPQLQSFMKFGAGGQTAFTGLGELGQFATQNKKFTDTLLSADPTKIQGGMDQLGQKTIKMAGGMVGATAELEKLKAAAGDVNSALYQRADAEQQRLEGQIQYRLPAMSQVGQGRVLTRQYQQAYTALYQHPGTSEAAPDAGPNFDKAKAALEDYRETQRQTFMGMLQTTLQFNTSMVRAEQDHGLQMMRAKRDYHNQVIRSERDFTLQMEHMNRDYHRTVFRAERDFGIQMQRETQQAAENIYDPYRRIPAQFTQSASALIANMREQNQVIAGQYKDLNKLKDLGLSQKAIDTLQLSDPKNAQQTRSLVQQITADPALAAQINRQVSTRVAATGTLVHSSFNEQFRNTTADFRRQMRDAARDIQTARSDAVLAQHNAMADMATDYHNTMHDAGVEYRNALDRAGQDLAFALRDWSGSLANIHAALMGKAGRQLKGFDEGAYNILVGRISALKNRYPELFEENPPGGEPRPPSSGGTGGTAYYRTPKGNIGYTDPNTGKEVQVKGADLTYVRHYYDTSKFPVNKTAGFQAGGISTHKQLAWVSETGQPEIHLPTRGTATERIFADVVRAVSREVAMTMHTAGHGVHGQAIVNNHIKVDKRTEFNGEITVCASDPDKMARELAAKARVRKLTHPNYRG